MKNKFTFLSLISLITFSACDKIADPFPRELGKSIFLNDTEYIVDKDFNVGNTNELNSFIDDNTWGTASAPDNSAARFVLLEEFTGHKCTFCPRGTREIVRLDGIYGDTLIPVGIHAGGFAFPDPLIQGFDTDFRVEGGHGETYNGIFNVSVYPSGVVSRLDDASGLDQWAPDIEAIKNDSPIAILKMTNYFSASNNAVRSNIEITWLATKPEQYNLQLYLVEDHIIDWQLDLGTKNPTYDHRHILRKVVNDTFGKTLAAAVNGGSEKIEYIFSSNASWNPDNLEVVAFIYNSDENNRVAIQANAAHVK